MNQIAHELATLLAADDPRSIAEMKAADKYEEGTLTEVTPYRGGDGYRLGYDHMGCGIRADRNRNGIVPEVGQTIRVYGPGFGSPFHGIDIDGREVFWLTPLERVARRVVWLAKHDRDKRERAVRDAPKIATDYASLSAPLGVRRSPSIIVISHNASGHENTITVADKDATLAERDATQEWIGKLVGELLSNRNGATRIFIERLPS